MEKYINNYCGNKVSEYGLKNGKVDYGTLASCFDAVLCNNIVDVDAEIFDNIIQGDFYDYENEEGDEITQEEYQKLINEGKNAYEIQCDIFQYYIIEDRALQYLQDAPSEIVLYSEKLDCYIWCITHFGTSWSYVLTEIDLQQEEEE